MYSRKFGVDIENLVKEKSSNHIVLKSRSFSFDGKSKAPSHITRKISHADQKPAAQINRTMLAEPALIVEKPSALLAGVQHDEQLVPVFLKDCINHMRAKERNRKQLADQIRIINPSYCGKRGALVDWMVSIHYQLELFPQTLFIAVSYMDDFCSKAPVMESELYLLGASCLFMAGKFEETYKIPCISAFQQKSGQQMPREDMIKMESRIMEELGFALIVDTPIKYLELFSQLSNVSQKNFYIAQYILELSLVEISFMEFSSSLLGASVTYLVNKIRKISPSWPSEFKELVGYDENELKNCAKNLCSLLEKSPDLENVRNIRAKFSKPKFCSASSIKLQRKNQ